MDTLSSVLSSLRDAAGPIATLVKSINSHTVAPLATFAAIIVALIPIFRDWRSRHRIAAVLRAQILSQLIKLMPLLTIELRVNNGTVHLAQGKSEA